MTTRTRARTASEVTVDELRAKLADSERRFESTSRELAAALNNRNRTNHVIEPSAGNGTPVPPLH